MDVKETNILGSAIGDHWYYSSKARAMERMLDGLLPSRILDVGAGSGFFSRHLLASTDAVEAWCVDTAYEADSDDNGDKPVHYRRSIDAVDADLVLLMDVLEHVEDDAALLRGYADKVPKGSRFLISVPAFRFLWSGHDDFLEHRRRYTLGQLEDTVRNAGLEVIHGAYFFAAVFPIAATMRLAGRILGGSSPPASQLKKHHPVSNAILKTLCAIERPFLRFNRAAGLTAFCLAKNL